MEYHQVLEKALERKAEFDPRHVTCSPDPFSALQQSARSVLPTQGRVVLVADTRTAHVGLSPVSEALAPHCKNLLPHILPDSESGESPVCDQKTKESLDASMPEADLFVAIGSGVVNDLVKWISFERDRPYLCLATAASMNGYASANVAPAIHGVKTLVRARPPVGIFTSPQILMEAPHRLTSAGLGDILAKSVSSADWMVNHLLFGDPYIPAAVNLIKEIEPLYLTHPEKIATHDSEAVAALFCGLLLTGAAMTLAETSSPASGGEHLVSHTLDMKAHVGGHTHDLHGRQVGIGTLLTSALYQRVLAMKTPLTPHLATTIDAPYWAGLAPVVEAELSRKQERLQDGANQLGAHWNRLREVVAPLLTPPEAIEQTLRAARAACTAEDIGVSPDALLQAFLHAHEMRQRFTILDLARLAGLTTPEIVEAVQPWIK